MLLDACINHHAVEMDDQAFKEMRGQTSFGQRSKAKRKTPSSFFFFPDELHRSTCWYLDCSRYWYLLTVVSGGSGGDGGIMDLLLGDGDHEDDAGGPRDVPVRLFLSLFAGLGLFLAVVYHLVWMCFWHFLEDGEEAADGGGRNGRRGRGNVADGMEEDDDEGLFNNGCGRNRY